MEDGWGDFEDEARMTSTSTMLMIMTPRTDTLIDQFQIGSSFYLSFRNPEHLIMIHDATIATSKEGYRREPPSTSARSDSGRP